MKNVYTVSFWDKHRNLVHGFSTKALGNVSFRTGDRDNVRTNRKRLADELGVSLDNIMTLPLSHSNRVLSLPKGTSITKDTNGSYLAGGEIFHVPTGIVHNNPEWQSGIDAVVTDIENLFPTIMSADCAAVGLFDAKRRVLALAHAGIIGAVNSIVPRTVKCMIEEYGSETKGIEAVIFPSIRKCHYDLRMSGVWKRIQADVMAHYGRSDHIFSGEKFDLQGLLCRQLIGAGIVEDRIHDVNLCTVCHGDMFFSNVAAGTPEAKKTEGRFASVVGVKNEI